MKQSHVLRSGLAVLIGSLAILATPVHASAALKYFQVLMNGPQQTPPTGSTATGIGLITYDTATKTLCYSITHTAGGELSAHIRGPAPAGVASGIVVIPLPPGATKSGCVMNPAAPFDKKDLFKNLYFIAIHTLGIPSGEIRGQILRIK